MHARRLLPALIPLSLTGPVLVATAQVEAPPSTQGRRQGLALELQGGYFDMTNAGRSAGAVFGGSGGVTLGGGVRIGVTRHLYAEASGRRFAKAGQRVFVADARSPVFRLGHPLEVRLTTFQATVGWRFRPMRSLVPYAGAGLGFAAFREESTVAGVTEAHSQGKPTGHVLAGAEYGRGRFRLAVEAEYLAVPDSIGVGGVSKVYGETDVGGFSVVAKVVIRLLR
jgi:opacity protein-like surface antigen